MREDLAKREGQRLRVQAKIDRYGSTPDGSVYLLTDVRDMSSGEELTDHVWMPIGKWAAGLRPGDIIAVDVTIKAYIKGNSWKSVDFRLAQARNAEIVVQGPIPRIR